MKNTQKKFLSAVLAASSVAGVVAPAVTAFAATATEVETLVANALKDRTFFSFNKAYEGIISLPAADQGKYLDKIAALGTEVRTAKIDTILNKIDEFYKTESVAIYDEVLYKLIPEVTAQIDRDYLSYELYKYGKPFYETKLPDYPKATDAIIAVDTALAAGKIADAQALVPAAEAAIAKVTSAVNNTYLNASLAEVVGRLNTAAPVSVSSVAAVTTKNLEVKFNKAVDTTKAVITVKKGSLAMNVSTTTFSADKQSVVLALSSKLTAGDYTVTVTGLSDTAITKTVTVQNEKIARFEVASDNAVIKATDDTQATISYKVFNQYNEDITKNASSITLTTTAGDQAATGYNASTGIITLDNSAAAVAYKAGDKVTISLLDSATGTFASKVVTLVAKAQTSTIEITNLYQADSKVLTGDTATGDVSSFKLILDAKDQYGNSIVPSGSDVVVTTSDSSVMNIAVADITTATIDGATKTVLPLTAPGTMKAGTAVITIISKTTGAITKYDVVVKDGVKADVFAVNLPELIVADATTKVPFTVTDTNGSDITSATKLSSTSTGITFTAPTGITLSFAQNYLTNKPELSMAVASTVAAGKYTIIATTANAKTITFVVDVKAIAVPTTIVGLNSSIATSIVKDQSLSISEDKVIVNDQYGREIGLDSLLGTTTGKYNLVVTEPTVSSKITLDTAVADADGDSLVIDGDAKGSTTLQLKLQKHNGTGFVDVVGSEYSFSSSVVEKADIVSYEIAAITSLYDDNAGGDTTSVTVNGILANGSKVTVPAAWVTLSTNNSKITVTGTTLDSNAANIVGTDNADVTVKVDAVVDATDAPVFLTKDFVVTKATPKVVSTTLSSSIVNGAVTFAAADVNAATFAAAVQDLFTFKNQYGNTLDNNSATLTFTNLVNSNTTDGSTIAVSAGNGTTTADIDQAASGDSFNVIVKAEGYSNTIKVIVTP